LKRTHTIGAVAQLTGVSADTIRFYERRGVLPKAPRNQSGYRVYPPELVERISFLKRARGLGFSLNEVETLLLIERHGPPLTTCEIRERIAQRLRAIEHEVADLARDKQRLEQLLSACAERLPCAQCHVINAIRR
jgi:MerR family mercuric resistance operon transcriptional regulator